VLVVAEILLKAGIDPNFKDVNGQTALQYAEENDFDAMVALIKKYSH
jgi:ankyrin repeat protein